MNVTYTLYGQNTTITATAHINEYPTITVGETTTFTFEINEADFGSILDYQEYAGGYSTYESEDTDYFFADHTPDTSSVGSAVIGVEPSNDLQNKDTRGAWGLVTNVADISNTPRNTHRIELELFIVAPFDEFATVGDVRQARETAFQVEDGTSLEIAFESPFLG